MRQTTLPEQTAKLIELGFEKPKSSVECELPKGDWRIGQVGIRKAYAIGELIEILDGVSELEITRFGSGWGAYDDLRAFTSEELIDALYDMIIMLKEEGII
jgi:hypothetical protein